MRSRNKVYCEVLQAGLLNIRAYAGDAERCFAEADHLHNLPALLCNPENEELHRYYWEVERPSFIKSAKPEWLVGYEALWRELEQSIGRESRSD
ncbi:MAG: hypothetical protein RIC55_31160 [Pirellulaceae bacterium]